MVSILASAPSCPGFDSRNFFTGKIVNAADANQGCCLEESGQWLENVD